MAPNQVLVISPSETLRASLSAQLPPGRFRVWSALPGSSVLEAVLSVRPQIAIVDAIDSRPEAAQLEIALVKSFCPEARVIALSGRSSGADASVLEQGVFYYMAAAADGELIRVLESAAQAHAGRGGDQGAEGKNDRPRRGRRME